MKALSLWQPWATLVAIGAKKNETRSWETLYRGPLAIHAAKTWSGKLAKLAVTNPYSQAMRDAGESVTHFKPGDALPKGHVVCTVDLTDCVRITEKNAPRPLVSCSCGSREIGPDLIPRGGSDLQCPVCFQLMRTGPSEYAFGDYTPDRFMWITANLRRLPEPIPYRGGQGLFNIPDDLIPSLAQPSPALTQGQGIASQTHTGDDHGPAERID